MKLRIYLITQILLFNVVSICAQDNIPTEDKIVFVDGTVLTGTLKLNGSRGITFNDNVKLCQGKKYKDCTSYKISDIDNIIQAPPELIVKQLKELKRNTSSEVYQNMLQQSENPDEFNIETYITYYKVLFNSDKENIGLATLRYHGKTADFYSFVKTGKNGGQTHITLPNTNISVFRFNSTATSNKFSLQQLTEYFKACSEFTSESTVKNAHKKNNMRYYYKLADKCTKQ
ncbi:hypothetical protein [Psychroserpens sp.]|uniref:hypothetical protein n=1 Tax=Psychroserpens sp. TaxID=2020870 RepID=UPI00385AB829